MKYVCSKNYKILCKKDCYHVKNIKEENKDIYHIKRKRE